jgi:hypothetical protein
MAAASGAQTERRGVPRPVRLPRGGEDAPAALFLNSGSELTRLGLDRTRRYTDIVRRYEIAFGEPAMTLTIDAIYENGVLRPAQALPLKEREKVAIVIHAPAGGLEDTSQTPPGDTRMAALQRLLAMGLPAADWEQMEQEITQGALE